MTVAERLETTADLTRVIADAVANALKAGMTEEDVAAVLEMAKEMVERGDD